MQSEMLPPPISFPSEWRLVRLKDLCSKIGSGATPTGGQAAYLTRRAKYALVRSQNVFDRRFSSEGLAYISDEQAAKLRGVELQENDILLNITGDGITFGRACEVDKHSLPACVNQHVSIVRVDASKACPGFVLSYLTHPTVKEYIESFNAGGSRRAITKGHIEAFVIPLPPMEQQVEISETLQCLDDKSALLHETNATLEAIAQALFKSWFVDFDHVRAKAEGRDPIGMPPEVADLFPSEFEDSELGEIPKGWQALPFGKLLNLTIGGDWGKDEPDGEHTIEVAIVRGTDMPDIKGGSIQTVPCRYVTPKKLKSRLLQDGDLIIEVSGGSKTQATGRSLYCTEMLLDGFGRPVVPASFCRLLRPLSREVGLLLAVHLSVIYAAGKMWNYQVQSTGLANFQTTHFLESELVVVPPEPVLKAFFDLVRPLVERQQTAELRNLAALRDTLLPRLMAGKLRIPELQESIEVAAP